jgi:hypothetical protein
LHAEAVHGREFQRTWTSRIECAWRHSFINVFSAGILSFQALVDEGVEFIVAPYEADAQMAYLAINGDVHAVITEDSDLLVYGCPRVRNNTSDNLLRIIMA